MKKTICFLLVVFLAGAAFAQNQGRNLIVYFTLHGNQTQVMTDANSSASRTIYDGKLGGNTEIIGRMIQEKVGGDMVLIETVEKFSTEYNTVVEEGKHTKGSKYKAIKTKVDLSKYDNVFLGFPNWWYDMPDPIFDFLEKHDLSGKNIYVFSTSGGSGLMRSISQIQKAQPNATVCKNGFHVYYTRVAGAKKDVDAWLDKNYTGK